MTARKSHPLADDIFRTILSVAVALLIFAAFLSANGANPSEIYSNMIVSTLGSGYGIGQVIVKTAPLLLVAIATVISAKAGLVNVGGEGQLAIGALTSTLAANFLLKNVPGIIGIPLMALFGMAGGMLWSGAAGLLKVKARMNETLTTVIMNYIAYDLLAFFVYGILKDPDSFNWPQSAEVASQLRLPEIAPGVSISIFFGLGIAALTWYVLKYSARGFRLKVIGGNVQAAIHSGLNVGRIQMRAMLLSGAISGLAGMLEISGIEGRLRATTGTNYGYYGFLAAWMAWNSPLGSIATAFVIGILTVAGGVLEITSSLPASATKILMAIILLAILWKGKKHD